MMELNHLQTFLVVAEEASITRAAERLFLAPPSVSAHIKALEEELHLLLFLRTSKGMILTEQGALLRPKAVATLAAVQDLLHHAAAMQTVAVGRLEVGLNAPPGFLRVAPLLKTLKERHPGIDLAFSHSGTGKILVALKQGALDAGYLFGPVSDPAVAACQVTTVELVIAAPLHWADQVQAASWRDLAQLPWICTNGYCPFQDLIDRIFRQHGLDYVRAAQSDDEATRCDLVSAGVGLSLLIDDEAREVEKQGRLVVLEHPPLRCDLSFAYPSHRAEDPLVKALVKAVMQVWKPNQHV
jgi:DNA-binding transcriptional LysR family regulator